MAADKAAYPATAGDGPDGRRAMDAPAHVATLCFSPKRSNGER
jgi:hypothetical protein